jgi:hypothetical protein
MNFVPTVMVCKGCLKNDKRDDTDQFFKKYPHALRKAKKDPRFKNYFEGKNMVVLLLVLSDTKKQENSYSKFWNKELSIGGIN